jgi:hypothetical protein
LHGVAASSAESVVASSYEKLERDVLAIWGMAAFRANSVLIHDLWRQFGPSSSPPFGNDGDRSSTTCSLGGNSGSTTSTTLTPDVTRLFPATPPPPTAFPRNSGGGGGGGGSGDDNDGSGDDSLTSPRSDSGSGDQNVEAEEFRFDGVVYFLDRKTDKVYEREGEHAFVGKLAMGGIDFAALDSDEWSDSGDGGGDVGGGGDGDRDGNVGSGKKGVRPA